jgi:GTP 3',8-cyclase
MFDCFNRPVTYLRVSVTDRCNLRCTYCMPAGGVQLLPKSEILSLEEIAGIVKTGAELGIRKIRLTGGEPLVRKGIVDLVAMISKIPEIEEVTMTTNGIFLREFALPLKQAGLSRINISLDSVFPDQYSRITGGGRLGNVLDGIKAAREAGLDPIKINVVRLDDHEGQNIDEIKKFAGENGLKVRFIRQMDLSSGTYSKVEGGEGGDCRICNRLRLTANGLIKPCLFSNKEFSVKEHGARNAFLLALNAKPEKGIMSHNHNFYNIGG